MEVSFGRAVDLANAATGGGSPVQHRPHNGPLSFRDRPGVVWS